MKPGNVGASLAYDLLAAKPDAFTLRMQVRFLKIALIAVTLAILGWSIMRANAAWHFLAARSITESMYESGEFTGAGIEEASVHLSLALMRFDNHPDYLALAGHLRELQAGLPGSVGRERRQYLETAATYYRRAITARPLWPYSWANLLSVKDKLGQVDEEFNRAMSRAVETGPWEPRVQLQVIRSGLRQWDVLQTAERSIVRHKLGDALSTQPREVFGIVRDFGRPDLLCHLETDQPQIERWCENVL
jgi:hypothetical protein